MNLVRIVLYVLVAVVLAVAAFAGVDGFEGTWVGTAELPDQTIDEVTVVLEKTDTGYKGKVSDALGMLVPETPLTEASYDGKLMKLVFPTVDGDIIVILLKPEGEKLLGQWSNADGESGKVEIARKK